jgi:hypothetical protein
MMTSKKILLGLATAAVSIAAPAFAQDGGFLGNFMMILYPDGHTAMMPIDKKTSGEAMTSSKPIGAPIMVMVSNGKAYEVTDMKMADGKMLSDYLGSTFGMSRN